MVPVTDLPLTATDISNYNYLCNEMLNLTGSGTACQNFVLPINLISFTGYQSSSNNILNWTVENANTIKYFDIEKSIDGSNFQLIGTKHPVQNAAAKSDYRFTDYAVGTTSNLYRVKLNNINGSSTYSQIILLSRTDKTNNFIVSPNPVKDFITIKASEALTDDITVTLTDMTGNIILHKIFCAGSNICHLENVKAAKGMYLINLKNKLLKKSFKIIIN